MEHHQQNVLSHRLHKLSSSKTSKQLLKVSTILVLILFELATHASATADFSSRSSLSDITSSGKSRVVRCFLYRFSLQISQKLHCLTESLTACQHLRRAEVRRAKSLGDKGKSIKIPKCSLEGDFERIQCSNEINGNECWCVDEYGVEITGTRTTDRKNITCQEPADCPASSCRMFCPAGFARDLSSGCPVCRCR